MPTTPEPADSADSTLGSTAECAPPVSAPGAGAFGVPERIGEFEIVSKLGAGAFGQVFLARQTSLGRMVALKVMRGAPRRDDTEGSLLAGLEHDHIVKVFSTFADEPAALHGLCLQYVPGADLGVVLRRVHEAGAPASGRALLDALDAVRKGDPVFDPGALRDRDELARDDFPQAVCRLGARLAEALAFAHARGVLHCDIKPANILVTPYGRPMLADFNVAFDRARRATDAVYGGTLAYMAPEYRAAMMGLPGGAADERCDIYSLGVVLCELATGVRPAPAEPAVRVTVRSDDSTAVPGGAVPGAHTPELPVELDRVPRELASVIRRCLDPAPARRYASASELAAALTGAGQLLAVRRALPVPGRAGRFAEAHPAVALALAGVLPHAVASVAQIGYNGVEIRLEGAQRVAFLWVTVGYNLLAYPVLAGLSVWLFVALARGLARLDHLSGPEVGALRGRARRIALRSATLGAVGWFPGALVFPLAVDVLAGPLGWREYAHFATSFTLAGIIGVVFSYLGIQFVVLRALLPRLGNPDAHAPAAAWAEVRPLTAFFGPAVALACAVPLVGAVLLLSLEGGYMSLEFRLLVVALIALGACGVLIAEGIGRGGRELAAVWRAGAE
jgi:serine/threonine protein kinase